MNQPVGKVLARKFPYLIAGPQRKLHAGRVKTVWQLKVLPVTGSDATRPTEFPPCDTAVPAWDNLVVRGTAMLNARTQLPDPDERPCYVRDVETLSWEIEPPSATTLEI